MHQIWLVPSCGCDLVCWVRLPIADVSLVSIIASVHQIWRLPVDAIQFARFGSRLLMFPYSVCTSAADLALCFGAIPLAGFCSKLLMVRLLQELVQHSVCYVRLSIVWFRSCFVIQNVG